ncbi:glycosyltransferase [Caldimonas tepidiphila]|uniref:glycosyltransferase n=1 Tax=Caldimonas tepidiphila TaxID=2315841 RepID=UPI000E5B83E8|nr:glycosyltransferase [Caldimonas tepidiphila]
MTPLQSFVFPNLDLAIPEAMYLRLNDLVWPDLAERRMRFLPGGCATSDTFYNALSVGPWKRHCDIRTLVLRLEGQGEFVVSFGLRRAGFAPHWLGEHTVQLNAGHPAHLPVPAWESVSDGLLYCRMRSVSGGQITAATFATPDAPPNEVRLGLVITHFNRQAQVRPAIRRLQRDLLSHPDHRGRITLTVVDNSKNLQLTPMPGLRVIQNENYGGSGGFTRGLLELLDAGSYTHALFMDDDASCEAESIARTFALLQYSREPRLAVAGSLLREDRPWSLIEKGAKFDGLCRPLCSGMDMRRADELLQAEASRERPDYGGWWFFAFPLREMRRFPFPFFVRGDDVFFSRTNRFEIATLNGVACLGEDFALKHGPMTAYLDARYHLLHALTDDPGRARRRVLRLADQLFFKSLLSYNYASARSFTLAMQHLMEGPDFFRRNLDLAAVRAEIGGWTPSEKPQPVDRDGMRLRTRNKRHESGLRRLMRILTLQGFLLPRFLLLDRTMLQPKGFHGCARSVFRFRRVLYEHGPTGQGYVVEHDRRLFFAELRRFLGTLGSLLRRLPELHAAHREGFDALASEDFWRTLYDRPVPAMPATPLVRPVPKPVPMPASAAKAAPLASGGSSSANRATG